MNTVGPLKGESCSASAVKELRGRRPEWRRVSRLRVRRVRERVRRA